MPGQSGQLQKQIELNRKKASELAIGWLNELYSQLVRSASIASARASQWEVRDQLLVLYLLSQGAIWPNAVDLQYGMHGPGWHSGPSVILG